MHFGQVSCEAGAHHPCRGGGGPLFLLSFPFVLFLLLLLLLVVLVLVVPILVLILCTAACPKLSCPPAGLERMLHFGNWSLQKKCTTMSDHAGAPPGIWVQEPWQFVLLVSTCRARPARTGAQCTSAGVYFSSTVGGSACV
ncbi:unnamed protein product [Prorocentrum cordatum]|uniref:Uncharacterized protein n=1 Tax=Prorocentrum cordatum TaxID=2364126 RepID=A0ABN9W4P2_9DINO|nr:unnamed protein product [Polarella glacialis]